MDTTKTLEFKFTSLWVLFWMAFVGTLLTGGCATTGSTDGAKNSRAEIVTDSDESADRKRARIRVELASGYFEQGKTNIALDEIKLAIAADPTFADAYSLRGLVYMRLNDFDFAEQSFLKALTVKPNDPNVFHNLGWMKCQQGQFQQSYANFSKALNDPQYLQRAKTLMTQGLCQIRAGQMTDAETSLLKSYEYDAGNPVTGYNLSQLLFQKKDWVRSRFYIRRINNSELANAETLWLGVKVEKQLANSEAVAQLAAQLEKRFPDSKEMASYRRGDFNE